MNVLELIKSYLSDFSAWIIDMLPKLVGGILILIIGFWIVKKVMVIIEKSMKRANLSLEVMSFLNSMIDIALKFVVVLVSAAVVGIHVTSLLGVLAAAGFAVGLALQGFLGNFAAGITIVFFKPYKVGDWVEISEKFGRVESIQIFNTIIITPGEKTLVIPNGQVTDNIITNFSTKGKVRLELSVNMAYSANFPEIKEILVNALKDHKYVLQDPPLEVGIENYDSHFIQLSVRPFVHPDDFWDATFLINQTIKRVFNEHGVQMAYSEGVELGPIGG